MRPKDIKLISHVSAYRTNEAPSRLIVCTEVAALAFPKLPPSLLLRLTKHKPKHNPHWVQVKYDHNASVIRAISYAPHFAPYFTRYVFVPSYSRLEELIQANPLYPFLSLILPTTTN